MDGRGGKERNDCINGRLFSDLKETRKNSSDVGGGRGKKGQGGKGALGQVDETGGDKSVRRLDLSRRMEERRRNNSVNEGCSSVFLFFRVVKVLIPPLQ